MKLYDFYPVFLFPMLHPKIVQIKTYKLVNGENGVAKLQLKNKIIGQEFLKLGHSQLDIRTECLPLAFSRSTSLITPHSPIAVNAPSIWAIISSWYFWL